MKLEVGIYVRTKGDGIRKVNGFHSTIYDDYIATTNGLDLIRKKNILKASHNIKELIEDDDLIKFKIYGELFICKVYNKSLINYDGEVFDLEELDIVSILTKEQYESMSYKVGE